jgi:predicted Ser/Thr protein kinase
MVVKENELQLVNNIQKQLKCKVIKVVGRGGQGLLLLIEKEALPYSRAVVKVATMKDSSKSMSVEIKAHRKLTNEETMHCYFLPIHYKVTGSFKDDYLLMHYYPISM